MESFHKNHFLLIRVSKWGKQTNAFRFSEKSAQFKRILHVYVQAKKTQNHMKFSVSLSLALSIAHSVTLNSMSGTLCMREADVSCKKLFIYFCAANVQVHEDSSMRSSSIFPQVGICVTHFSLILCISASFSIDLKMLPMKRIDVKEDQNTHTHSDTLL